MTRKVAAAIAGAFAAGVFVAAAPSVLGHGPGAGADAIRPTEAEIAMHMREWCDGARPFEHMAGTSGHMAGTSGHMAGTSGHMAGTSGHMAGDLEWMVDMMTGAGVER